MLKALPGALVLLAMLFPGPAAAGTLLTGAIRDGGGVAVEGARVTAFDRTGRVVGVDTAIADGTFAIDLRIPAATVAVDCDYCESQRRVLERSDEPVILIVRRFAAVARDSPSAADLRALPFRGAADVASLRPFTVSNAGRISDRGLDVYGATLVNGLPFYSAANGDNYSELVPAHAIAALPGMSPLVAPVYGGYAAAGVYDVRTFDPDAPAGRIDAGNGFDLIARANAGESAALYANSNDRGYRYEAGGVHVDRAFAGGRVTFDALDMAADDFAHASGAGLAYSTDSRRYATTVSLRATQSDDASLVTFDAHVRNRGSLALEFGVRETRSTAAIAGSAAVAADGAIYTDASWHGGSMTLRADLAADRGGNFGPGGDVAAQALIGSLSDDVRVSANWSAHYGLVSNLRIPTFAETAAAPTFGPAPANRSLLFEQSLTYSDLRRLRLTGIVYTERTTGALSTRVNGVGIEAGWQIAPQWSLRGWLLRANQSATYTGVLPATLVQLPSIYASGMLYAAPLTRQLAWLSYENVVRVDALVRGEGLEGDVRFPLGRGPLRDRFALILGTAKIERARITTLGVTLR